MGSRRSRDVAKTGILLVVLVLAMGVMGISYNAWADMLNVNSTVGAGIMNTSLACYTPHSDGVGCTPSQTVDMTLEITVNPAIDPGTGDGKYVCNFIVENDGTLPVKISAIGLTGVPGGVIASITSVAVDTQIDPAIPVYGYVTVNVTEGYTVDENEDTYPDTFTFYLGAEAVIWNQ